MLGDRIMKAEALCEGCHISTSILFLQEASEIKEVAAELPL